MGIAHEFIYMVYHDTICVISCVWFEEGLDTYLSEPKGFIERNSGRYKEFLKRLLYEEKSIN